MATKLAERYISAEEFLAMGFERGIRVELDNGVIRMMAGGTLAHDRVQTNLIAALHNALRGSGCRPHGSDAAVRTNTSSIRYPDVSVTCENASVESDGRRELANPRVVIEVLSPSTENEDRGVKFAEYRALASMEAIVLIDPDRDTILGYERINGGWQVSAYNDRIRVPSLGIDISNEDIFARD